MYIEYLEIAVKNSGISSRLLFQGLYQSINAVFCTLLPNQIVLNKQKFWSELLGGNKK